jgi:16S rRNA C967 or C1407 C5-methylase (RsmB/RsmF family)
VSLVNAVLRRFQREQDELLSRADAHPVGASAHPDCLVMRLQQDWSDDWRVIVSSYRLSESGPEALKLAPYAGRLLQFAEGTSMRPKMDFFRSHRHHHGLAG